MNNDLKKIETYSPFPEDRRTTEEKVKGVGLRTGAPDLDVADGKVVRKDAEGQFAASEADGNNDGMTSAEPRVLSKDGQAKTVDQQDAHARDVDDAQSTKRNASGSRD